VEISRCNDLSDGDWIVASAERFVTNLALAVPVIMRKSPIAGLTIGIEVDDRPGFLVYIKRAGEGFLIRVPRGLVLRLIALFRLLLPYFSNEPSSYHIASPLDHFSIELFHTPRQVAPIFEDFDDLDALRAALTTIRFPRELEPKAYWGDIEAMTNLAIRFVICHELAHATGRHMELRELGKAGVRLSEFGLTLADVRLATEMAADIEGTYTFMFLSLVELASDPADPDLWARLATRAGFAIPALFGLWDHKRKIWAAFADNDYPASTLRHRLFADSAPQLLQDDPARCQLWLERELDSWTRCVYAFQQATRELGKAEEIPEGKLLWPIGSLNYGGPAAVFFMQIEKAQKDAVLDRFRRWESAVKSTLPEPPAR
jgi:hypothetical protein